MSFLLPHLFARSLWCYSAHPIYHEYKKHVSFLFFLVEISRPETLPLVAFNCEGVIQNITLKF